ncbi:MAG: hypothetical protein V1735_04545 [Nanoarchaeota archaeon]
MTQEPKAHQDEFVNAFASFYHKFFDSSADAVDDLASIQEHFKEEYKIIKEFGNDPKGIMDMIEKMPTEAQGKLLKILLRAGIFGKKMTNLFESTVEDKRAFAKDLKSFANELSQEIERK